MRVDLEVCDRCGKSARSLAKIHVPVKVGQPRCDVLHLCGGCHQELNKVLGFRAWDGTPPDGHPIRAGDRWRKRLHSREPRRR